jgi:hypothetical protein
MARPLGRGGRGRVRALVLGLPTVHRRTVGFGQALRQPPLDRADVDGGGRCGEKGVAGLQCVKDLLVVLVCAVRGAFDMAAAQDPYPLGPAGEHLEQHRQHGVVDRFDDPEVEGRVVEHELLDRGGGAAAVQEFPERPEVLGAEYCGRRPGGRQLQHPANLEQLQRGTALGDVRGKGQRLQQKVGRDWRSTSPSPDGPRGSAWR